MAASGSDSSKWPPLAPGDSVVLIGRFRRGRAAWRSVLEACGARIDPQLSQETTLVVVGSCGWPLRRNGRLPRDLLIAQALRTQSGRPDISSEEDCPIPDGSDPASNGLANGDPVNSSGKVALSAVVSVSLAEARRNRDLARLVSEGVPISRVRRGLAELARWFPDARTAEWSLRSVSGSVAIRGKRGWMTPDGQRLLDFGEPSASSRVVPLDPVDPLAPVETSLPFRKPPDEPVAGVNCDGFALAVAAEQAGEWAEAERAYRQLLREEGPDADVCFNLANVLAAEGRLDAAIERLTQAVELRPGFVEGWYNLGVMSLRAGRRSAARDAFATACQLAPDFQAARTGLEGTVDS